jgi:hypothetical protein
MIPLWSILKHRREEVARYKLGWIGWTVRLGLMSVGVLLLWLPEKPWRLYWGAVLIVLPLFYRQIPYEIATLLFAAKKRQKTRAEIS